MPIVKSAEIEDIGEEDLDSDRIIHKLPRPATLRSRFSAALYLNLN